MKSIESQLKELGRVKDCKGVMPTLQEIGDIAYLMARERACAFDDPSWSVDIFHSTEMYDKCIEIVMEWSRDIGGTTVKDFTKGNCFGMRATIARLPTIDLNFVDADCMGLLRPGTLAAIAMCDLVYEGRGYSMMCPKAHFVWRNCMPNQDSKDALAGLYAAAYLARERVSEYTQEQKAELERRARADIEDIRKSAANRAMIWKQLDKQ